MKPRFYDSHAHLRSMHKKSDALIEETVDDIHEGRLSGMIDVGIDVDDLDERLPLISLTRTAWFSVGIYPSHANDTDIEPQLEKLSRLLTAYRIASSKPANPAGKVTAIYRPELPNQTTIGDAGSMIPRLVAIGEIGIDCYHDYGSIEKQSDLLSEQVRLANEYHLPVIIHNREADRHLTPLLTRHRPAAGGIMHCFSSNFEMAESMAELGFYISFAGNLTYKSSGDLRDVARRLPLDRLLCETDSPYLSPLPYRGSSNRPGRVALVYECLAELRGISVERLSMAIEENFMRFVGEW